jgi:pyruvate,orthophosphate dikinase
MARFGHGSRDVLTAEEYGNKATNLATMASLGIPVPPGFCIGVSVCEEFSKNNGTLPLDVPEMLKKGVEFLEKATGLTFGSTRRPLLVSVRSGAAVSMPGIMETLLDIGLNPETVRGLIFMTGNPRFAWDSYRRLVESFASTVFSMDHRPFRTLMQKALASEGVPDETELDAGTLKGLATEYEELFFDGTRRRFPEDVGEQLELAVKAVLRSWRSPRAESFRRMNLVKGVRGTAVTVQAMVFGNMGQRSGAGVAFTRNPSTGENEPLIDFKLGVQGEDVVSGEAAPSAQLEMSDVMPDAHRELIAAGRKLESYFKDMQDLEFTVQEGRLYLLQSRSGKRAPLASLRIAVEMCREGLISPEDALARLKGVETEAILVQKVVTDEPPLGMGVSASTGVASGKASLTVESAERYAAEGTILVRETANPDDISGIAVSAGILAARGARTSHAAVVARQMGKVCIVNCPGLEVDIPGMRLRLGGRDLREGEILTLDGNTGAVYAGKIEVTYEKPLQLLAVVRDWKKAYEKKE